MKNSCVHSVSPLYASQSPVQRPPPDSFAVTTARAREPATILEHAIETGVLAPGTRLHEAPLAKRFSVSRTPVREALRELAVIAAKDAAGAEEWVRARVTIEVGAFSDFVAGLLSGLLRADVSVALSSA